MVDIDSAAKLASILPKIRSRIMKYAGNRRFNEQNTKASLIIPVLDALGWDANEPEEVQWEYKPKPRYNPVDFALMLQRTPCLFLEAKALREDLSNDRLTAQLLTYSSVAGVQWAVLTNGDQYRIYNANAPVPIEDKLFRSVSVSSSDRSSVIATLSLLSKTNLQDKKIGRLWKSHFVDRQVGSALEDLLNPEEPARTIVRAIKKLSDGKLTDSDIRASLRRINLGIDFPEEPEIEAIPPKSESKAKPKKGRRGNSSAVGARPSVSLKVIISEGLLSVPCKIHSRYRKNELTATVERDGSVTYEGEQYSSLSTAGGMARKPFHKGDLKGREYPQTNGWIFWEVRDSASGKDVPIDTMRKRYLEKKGREAKRFLKRDA